MKHSGYGCLGKIVLLLERYLRVIPRCSSVSLTSRYHSGVENKVARSISSKKQSESHSHSEQRSNLDGLDRRQGQFGDFRDRELYLAV